MEGGKLTEGRLHLCSHGKLSITLGEIVRWYGCFGDIHVPISQISPLIPQVRLQ